MSGYTLKVNIRAQEERERREKERQTKEAIAKIQANAGPPARPRKRKGLNFHEPGYYIAQAEMLRKKAKLEALQKKIAEASAKTGIADAVKLATLTTTKTEDSKTTTILEEPEEEIPEIEWWDKILLGDRTLDEVVVKLNAANIETEEIFTNINNIIECPPIKKPPIKVEPALVPVFLTKEERKKLRRQNRKAQELDKQEKIKFGLLPKPEPKLKQSNIMYALGHESIINPSKADQLSREQEDKRRQAHIEHNEAKKLTPEERKAKNMQKISEDLTKTGTCVSIYRVEGDLSRWRFKVRQNAKQLTMTGVLITCPEMNLVVVEGGPKQQRRYQQLMMNRIKWDESGNSCKVVWEGVIDKPLFKGFRDKTLQQGSLARDFLSQFKADHYWDLATKMSILASIEDM